MVKIKTPEEIAVMERAGRILAEILDDLAGLVREAKVATTGEVEARAQQLLTAAKVTSPFRGYQGFPSATCVSVNEEVVHGLPGPLVLEPGDLVGIDLGVVTEGLMADSAITVPFGGESKPEDARLIRVAEEALGLGIGKAFAGNTVGDISAVIQGHVEEAGFSVVRALTGHGVGRSLHEEPSVPNFGRAGEGPRLEAGMTICIEPMITAGGPDVVIRPGVWPVVTADGSRAAHVEHTVLITDGEPHVLTRL